MKPVFIYCDIVKFQNNDYKIFKVDFSNGDNLESVFFRKSKDYYITSMSSFITLKQDLKELKHYDDIKKITEISNEILKNGIKHLYKEKLLEATLEDIDQKIELQPDKSNRGLSVHAVEFFDEQTKTKGLVYVYSPYEELKKYGLKFVNKGKNIYKYTINMKDENEKLYLEKKLFFDKKKAIDEIIKEIDRKNTIFYKYNGELVPVKLSISDYFYRKIEEAPNFDMKKHLKSSTGTFSYYIYHGLFENNKSYNHLIMKGYGNNPNAKYPLLFTTIGVLIGGDIEYYITPELYARNKSIFKNLNEIPAIDITSTLLTRIRTLLNDPSFSVSKIYGFKNLFHTGRQTISYNDIILPEFNVSVKIKSPKKVNDVFKNTFESTYNLSDNKTYSSQKTSTPSSDQRIKTIKENAPEKIESSELLGKSDYLKKLS